MAAAALLLAAALVALGSGHGGEAFDPNPLQDFCVADATSKDMPGGTTSKRYGFSVLTMQIPGLNTQGQSHARVDLAPGAVLSPHYHPRASETALVLDGSVYFGFVSSYPDNKLFSKVLHKGDVFSVPQGLVHFLHNNDTAPATLYASLSSQNPGLVLLADALFAGALPDELLAKTFLTDKHTVENIRENFRRP